MFASCFPSWSRSTVGGVYAGVRSPTATFCVDMMLEMGGRKLLLEMDVAQLETSARDTKSAMAQQVAQKNLVKKQEHMSKLTDFAATLSILSKQTDLQWLLPSLRMYNTEDLRKMTIDDLLGVAERTITQLQRPPKLILKEHETLLPSVDDNLADDLQVTCSPAAAAAAATHEQ